MNFTIDWNSPLTWVAIAVGLAIVAKRLGLLGGAVASPVSAGKFSQRYLARLDQHGKEIEEKRADEVIASFHANLPKSNPQPPP